MASGLVRWPEEHYLGETDGPGLQVGALVQVQRRSPPLHPAVYGDMASGSPQTLRAGLGAHR